MDIFFCFYFGLAFYYKNARITIMEPYRSYAALLAISNLLILILVWSGL